MEYKSPGDELNIDTFYKCGAYASLYKSYGETVDGRTAEDITVSIVRQNKPAGLFGYFKEHRIRVMNPYRGIYYVMDAVLFPTQIVVTKELDKKEHAWLTALSEGLEKQDMKELLEIVDALTQKLDRELADAVLEVSIRANRKIVEELKGMKVCARHCWKLWNQKLIRFYMRLQREKERKRKKKQGRKYLKQ